MLARTVFPSSRRTRNIAFGKTSSITPGCSVLFSPPTAPLHSRSSAMIRSVTSSGLPTPSTRRRSPCFS